MLTQLGAQMYTVREYTKTGPQLLQSLGKVKEAGYQAVQLSGHGAGIPHEEIATYLAQTGLTCAATHISFEAMQNDLADVIRQHKLWNCTYVGVGAMPAAYRDSREGFIAFAKEASAIAARLKAEGLQFIYHNHQFEFRKFGDMLGMELLLDNASQDFQFEMDTYWVQTGGGDVIDWIHRLAGRMDVIHFKDMAVNEEAKPIMVEIGQGNLNWDGILKACRESGIKWYLVEQDVCQRSPFESLRMSREFLAAKGIQ